MNVRDTLLRNVREIPKFGVPGTLVVFGDKAEAILTGSEPSDVIIAAAEHGKGKILAVTHGSYVEQFIEWFEKKKEIDEDLAKLFENVVLWMTNGKTLGKPENVGQASTKFFEKQASSEISAKIVTWMGDSLSDSAFKALQSFVKDGGCLVCGVAAWGYLQNRQTETLFDMQLNKLLGDAGIVFTCHYAKAGKISVSENKAQNSHLKDAISALKYFDKTEDGDVEKCYEVMIRGLHHVPEHGMKPFTSELKSFIDKHKDKDHYIPTRKKPVRTARQKLLMTVVDVLYRYNNWRLPGSDIFPGVLKAEPNLIEVTVEVTAPRGDYYATGYYAPPGQEVNVTVLSKLDVSKPWAIMIGCHTDNNYDTEKIKRWPILNKKELITARNLTVLNAFGGNIYLISPKNDKSLTMQIRLEGVVEAPYFNLKDKKSVEDWQRRKETQGLWADLVGEFVTLTMPSASVRDVDCMSDAMKHWDKLVQGYYDLKGVDIHARKRQWIVFDMQPRMGLMHSGYPVVAQLDNPNIYVKGSEIKDFCLDLAILRTTGKWGMYHEIGHNMQDPAWTFDGTREVTVNIFTLHGMEKVSGVQAWIHPWIESKMPAMKKYLDEGAQFGQWQKQAGVALGVYAQLVKHCGWDAFKTVFRQYENMKRKDKPSTLNQKIDEWVTRFSKVVGMNLIPLFEFWGIPIGEGVGKELVKLKLKPFLPMDELVSLSKTRESLILAKYKDIIRQSSTVQGVTESCPAPKTPRSEPSLG